MSRRTFWASKQGVKWTALDISILSGFVSRGGVTRTSAIPNRKKKGRRSECPRDTLLASPSLQPRAYKEKVLTSNCFWWGGKPFVMHDSITDFWVVPEISLSVTWIKHQHISASQWNSKSPSVETRVLPTYFCPRRFMTVLGFPPDRTSQTSDLWGGFD